MKWLSLYKLFVCAVLFGVPFLGYANEHRNDIPSCYQSLGIKSVDQNPQRNVILVIDETFVLPDALKDDAYQKVTRFVKAGDRIYLYKFSAFLAGHYFGLPFVGYLEVPLTGRDRNSTSMVLVKNLDACIDKQKAYFKKMIGKTMLQSFAKENVNIAKSEIFSALQQIGKDIQVQSSANENIILLMSDMLENSEFTSFYANQSVKEISVKAELDKVTKSNLVADLNQARVFVLGAGILNTAAPNSYRSGKIMQTLEEFWREYFVLSNAELMAFGSPALTVDLH